MTLQVLPVLSSGSLPGFAMHLKLSLFLRKLLPSPDHHTMYLSHGTKHLSKVHTGFQSQWIVLLHVFLLLLTLTISAVAVAMPLMRCMKFKAMRSATRIESALPRTTPNRVPDVTAVPSDAVQVTWTERDEKKRVTFKSQDRSIMRILKLALVQESATGRRITSQCKWIAGDLRVGVCHLCHWYSMELQCQTSIALRQGPERDEMSVPLSPSDARVTAGPYFHPRRNLAQHNTSLVSGRETVSHA